MATLLSLGSKFLVGLISMYQVSISPLLGKNCRFNPTCSNYGIEALRRFGAVKGGWLTIKRILRCHPLSSSGEDPVPPRLSDTKEH